MYLEPQTLYLAPMDAERLRAFLLTLPHVAETMQWGANLVFWVGDKAIGGKMFALIDLDEPHQSGHHNLPPVISYAAGSARMSDLLELDGLIPAPYFARAHWVAALRWDVFSAADWQRELRAAHALTLGRLPQKARATLALPAAKQKALIAARRKLLAAKATKTKK
ncbi:MAG: MmcQ/YjbR family DNA-binding protein [Acidobacteriaceae bacterium]